MRARLWSARMKVLGGDIARRMLLRYADVARRQHGDERFLHRSFVVSPASHLHGADGDVALAAHGAPASSGEDLLAA